MGSSIRSVKSHEAFFPDHGVGPVGGRHEFGGSTACDEALNNGRRQQSQKTACLKDRFRDEGGQRGIEKAEPVVDGEGDRNHQHERHDRQQNSHSEHDARQNSDDRQHDGGISHSDVPIPANN
jgi:hypothetical protein